MIKIRCFIFLLMSILSLSCNINNSAEKKDEIPLGKWRGVLEIQNQELPFIFEVKKTSGQYTFEIANGEERIFMDEITFQDDSFTVKFPVFDSELKGKVTDGEIKGFWFNNARKSDNIIPFKAFHAIEQRFITSKKPDHNITGKWEINFYDPSENNGNFTVRKAIGEFTQTNEIVTGTIITPTGDYRYLEGVVDEDVLMLSCFDGAHAYLFKAKIEDSKMEGDFWSGSHYTEKWQAERNDHFSLPDADTLTYLKSGYTEIDFTFPDLSGKEVSFKDEKYKDKVVIVQIMGSWCPNCLDETIFLSELYNQYNPQGLEIIALAYEKSSDYNKAKIKVSRLVKKVDASYDFLIAGTSDKKAASETLPFLNHVMAFPTTIFVDRKGNVRKIHTGFTGPGTGSHYQKFVEQTTVFLEKLLGK